MRITLLANRDLGANVVADGLLRALPEHHWSLVLSSRVGRPGPRAPALVELAHQEQGLLRQLVEPLTRDPAQRPGRVRSFPQLARIAAGGLHELDAPRGERGRALLASLEPDLLLSVRYGGILDEGHVALARHGVLNLHSGRLPDYRGVLASFRALLAGDGTLACTLHRIVDAGIDTGPILASAELPVDPDRSMLAQLLALYGPGTRLLVDAVQRLDAGEALPGTPQDPAAGAYHGVPDAAELDAFHARGLRLCELGETLAFLREAFTPLEDASDGARAVEAGERTATTGPEPP